MFCLLLFCFFLSNEESLVCVCAYSFVYGYYDGSVMEERVSVFFENSE